MTRFSYNGIKMPKESTKDLTTIVFVDYESLFWSLYNFFRETPELDSFLEDVKKQGTLVDRIKVFGDFSKPEIKNEISKIRTITSDITNCENANPESKKEFTDFIMLDHIYQTIITNPHIQQYILVTGDGHFHSVATFLRTFKDKIVGIYSMRSSLSAQLLDCSTWAKEISFNDIYDSKYVSEILQCIQRAQDKYNIIPSFAKTVEQATKYFQGDKLKYQAALSRLISDNYIEQKEVELPNETGRKVNALIPNWELMKADNLLP